MNSRLTVFKGGTAFNSYLKAFQRACTSTTYIIPITDDGGSSHEIRRVFGGPSIGDIRSTLTRLSDVSSSEAIAVKSLLEHRLPADDYEEASAQWHALLEDNHELYSSISSKYKELIRFFLCAFEAERLRKISSHFDPRNGSVGNFFFSGARMALGSLETAIFVYASIARIPTLTHVLPIIDSSDRLSIGVRLKNGECLIGQHLISHPGDKGRVEKESYIPLPSSIEQLFYVDKYNNPIHPEPHSSIIHDIKESRGVVYGVGSFWTSIVPSLILKGIGETLAAATCPKMALLNCCHDREIEGMTAVDYIHHLTNSLNRYGALSHEPKTYISDLLVVQGCDIPIDEGSIKQMGIQVHWMPADSQHSFLMQNKRYPLFSPEALVDKITKST